MNETELKQYFEDAFYNQQNGNVDEAIVLFKKILDKFPNHADALHGLGIAYAQKKQLPQAISYLTQAIQQAPNIPGFHNNLANAYKRNGQLDLAQRHYLEALRLKSPYSEANNNLGNVYYLQGLYSEAAEQFKKALRINPALWDAHFNLANCYLRQDLFLEAKPHLEEVLKYRADHLGAINNLGIIYCLLKQFEAAIPLLETVMAREPSNAESLFHLSIAYASSNQLEKAKQGYIQVLTLNDKHDKAHHNLATLYLHLNDKESALKHYEKAYQLNPHNQTALHMHKALTGETLKEGAPHEYTRALFDQYAYNYNQHMKEQLKYKVPELLRSLINPYSQKKSAAWKVLDLGCGTGLCAPYFMDISDKLYGVDLSPNMVDQAAKLDAYYKLAVSDISDYLLKTKENFELIIAADVFVYFGDLESILNQCYKVMTANAYFLFSIESLENGRHPTQDYQLSATGRYQHNPDYIKSLAEQLGFKKIAQQTAAIRQQETGAVIGELYLLQK